ncbi:MAG: HAD family hydrolase [Bacilli bacterium]|nr:HAD family hydrolase [Bacilli bacterium]
MNKINLVVFDFDGTIADSDLALIKIGLKMSERFLIKKDVSIDDFLFLNGPSLDESLPVLFPGYDIKELKDAYYALAPDSAKDITLFPGVKGLLKELKNKKIEVAIFTSRSRFSTELILKRLGLLTKFKMIVCGDDGFPKKPSGEGLKHIIKTLGTKPEKTLFVGDNWRDILAGKDVGAPVAFIRPYRRIHKLDLKAPFVINDIMEILEVINNERK